MSKFCIECGKKLADNATNCPGCGYEFETITNVNIVDNGKPKGSIGWLIFWIIMVGPFALFYFFIRSWSK